MGFPTLTLAQRVERWFKRSIEPSGDCWIWTGGKSRNGYGMTHVDGKHWMAHRIIYTYMVGPIPVGLDLDHLCRVRACVNPWHLDPVSRSVNLARGEVGGHGRAKTHCPQNHPYSAENTAIRHGRRHCRACERARAQRNRDRKAVA